MLIDTSYFVFGPRRILNATSGSQTQLPAPGAQEINEAILGFVCAYQEEFLKLALGGSAGNKAQAYLVRQEEDGDGRIEAYEKALERLREPFADYVFYHILRDTSSQPTIGGAVRIKSANEPVSSVGRQADSWNRMVAKMRDFAAWVAEGGCSVEWVSVDEELLTPVNRLNL